MQSTTGTDQEEVKIGGANAKIGGANTNGDNQNKTLEREVTGWSNLFIYSFAYIMLEMWKQIVTYGMKYYNDDKYPLPQTQIIAITELLKLVIFAGIVIRNGEINQVKFSLWYVIPSVVFAINNNIFYFALYYTTPPLWSVLIQLRIPFTALVYRFIFHKVLTPLQWFALLLLVSTIALSNLTGGQTLKGNNNLWVAGLLAIVGSLSSVVGTIVMEYLFKNDKRSFGEMQMQLYLFGTMMTWVLYLAETFNTNMSQLPNVSLVPESRSLVFLLLGLAILLSCSSGIAVASIVKKLDNIVKLYTQAIANMATSVACTLFFPDHFQINIYFIACLMVMFLAIFLFERKTLQLSELVECITDWKSSSNKIVMSLVLLLVLIGCLFISDKHLFMQLGNKTSNGNGVAL